MSKILVAVDIEKAGSNIIAHPVVSVGFCVGYTTGTILEKKKFNMKVNWFQKRDDGSIDYGDFEPRCVDEFWLKQPQKVMDLCLHDPEPLEQKDAWEEIRNWIDSLEQKYPESKIKFISDNASFDVASIDYNLEKYTGRSPMRYSSTGKYRGVYAGDDMFSMLPEEKQKECKEKIDKIVIHDHDPVNDAHFILLQYVAAHCYTIGIL